jgi:hypothetical protein
MRSTFTLLVLLASSVRSSPLKTRKDSPDEAVYLVSCSSTGGGQLSLHDYVYWYGDDADGQKGLYPGITATPTDPGPHDGMIYNIDWLSGTKEHPITADLRGTKFTLYDLNDKGAKKGDKVPVEAKLGTEDMDCYKDDRAVPDSLKNKSLWNCAAKYRCTRDVHWTRTAKLNLYNATTTIGGFTVCDRNTPASPYKAFGHYSDWAASMTPPNTPYKLYETQEQICSISFHTVNVDQNSKTPLTIGDVQQFWRNAIARSVDLASYQDPKKTLVSHVDIYPYCKIPYPSGGYLAVQSTQDNNPNNHFQAEYHFAVTCGKKNKCDPSPAVGLLSGIMGSLVTVMVPGPISGAITGVVNGLNAICAFS